MKLHPKLWPDDPGYPECSAEVNAWLADRWPGRRTPTVEELGEDAPPGVIAHVSAVQALVDAYEAYRAAAPVAYYPERGPQGMVRFSGGPLLDRRDLPSRVVIFPDGNIMRTAEVWDTLDRAVAAGLDVRSLTGALSEWATALERFRTVVGKAAGELADRLREHESGGGG